MKVLFVFNEKIGDSNKYISTLKDALIAEGIEATCSVDDFWNNYEKYDIVHFQWFQGYAIPLLNVGDVNRFIEQINKIKNRGEIIVTCHDFKSHYSTNNHIDFVLHYVYEHCDAMIHLGQYSCNHFNNQSATLIKHCVIPHHIYNNLYLFSLDKSVARKQLRIPLNANVLLCFGAFRSDIERNMILKAWGKAKIKNKYLLAPGFYRPSNTQRNIIRLSYRLMKALYYKLRGVRFTNDFVPHNMVETYLCASDILMIQRAVILNSGNLSLGFHAGKVVVGPNVGNVKEILEETGNPVFDPNDISSVTRSIQEGFRLKDTDLPQKNLEYAMTNWNVAEIARKHIEVYWEILKGKANEPKF
jgi:glycosyltransferase involved in cell wall biosynthesis